MRLFVWLGSLLVLALLAALVVPPFFDWNRFRANFEQEASRVLGQPVIVRGETTARLLPLPSVTFSDIRVGEGNEPMLTAKSFHVNVELAPLLKGDVVIVDMSVAGPKLDVRIDKNGKMDWSLRREGAADLVSANDVAVENITITDGLLRVRDVRFEREFILRNLDATATAGTLAGPWRGDAQFSFLGEKIKLQGSTGRLRQNSSITLNATLKPQSQPYDITFEGPLSVKDSIPSATGIVSVKPVLRQSDEERIAFPRRGVGESLPVRFEGDLELGSAGASMPAFRIEVGQGDDPYTLIGSGQAVFGEDLSFRAKAEGQQINLERLSAAQTKTDDTTDKDLTARLSALADLLKRIPRFEAQGDIDVRLPAVIAGDTTVRDISLNMRPLRQSEGWYLSEVKALLPGRTELRADGELGLGQDLSWNGALILASKQPSGLARWLSPKVDPAIRRMKTAGLSANASITADIAELKDLEIALDGSQLRGSLRRETHSDKRPSLSAALTGGKADLEQLIALFQLFAGETQAASITAHDVDLKLNLNELAFAGFVAAGVSGALAVADSTLRAEDIVIGDLDGVRINGQALLEGFPDAVTGSATGSFSSASPVRLLQKLSNVTGRFTLPRRFVDSPDLLADSFVAFELKPERGRTLVSASGEVGGSRLEWRFSSDTLTNSLPGQNLDTTLILDNDDEAKLLLQLGFPIVPGDFGGRGAFRGTLKGAPADGADIQAALTLGNGYATVGGVLTDHFDGKLRIRTEIEDLDPFIRYSGLAVPGQTPGLSGDLSGQAELAGQIVKLTQLEGTLDDSVFSGSLVFDRAAKPRPSVKGSLKTDFTALDTLSSTVFAPGAASDARLFSGLDADLAVSIARLEIPAELAARTGHIEPFEAELAIFDGDMAFENIKAKFAGGELTGRVTLGQNSSARAVGGQVTLAGGDGELFAGLLSETPWLSGTVGASGTFESAVGNNVPLVSGLTGSGTITLDDGNLSGIDAAALKSVLRIADSTEDDQLTQKADDIVEAGVSAGNFAFGPAQAAFSIASGVLRAGGVRLENEQASLDADVSVDMNNGTVQADAAVSYKPGRDAVVGAKPEFSLTISGSKENRSIKTDTSLFSTYLGLRLSEGKQREFEAQKASILERQRLLRTARLYQLKEEKRRLQREEQERIDKLRREEQERQRLEQIRRAREALEQAKLEAELKAAERRAETEAAAEAGRRAQRGEEIELLRRRAEQEARRRKNADEQELLDFKKLELNGG